MYFPLVPQCITLYKRRVFTAASKSSTDSAIARVKHDNFTISACYNHTQKLRLLRTQCSFFFWTQNTLPGVIRGPGVLSTSQGEGQSSGRRCCFLCGLDRIETTKRTNRVRVLFFHDHPSAADPDRHEPNRGLGDTT